MDNTKIIMRKRGSDERVEVENFLAVYPVHELFHQVFYILQNFRRGVDATVGCIADMNNAIPILPGDVVSIVDVSSDNSVHVTDERFSDYKGFVAWLDAGKAEGVTP